MSDKTLLFLYDLPKDKVTSNVIASIIKEKGKYDLVEPPQIRRDPNKPFYTAIVKINDPEKFKEVASAMKYFEIEGKPCRALPYDRDLIGANRSQTAKSNVFLKNIDKSLKSEDVENKFKEKLGDVVKSTKISINPDYTSRGYGFVLFANQDEANKALKEGSELGFEVHPYNPRDRREIRKIFNNIYVKNFPNSWDEAKLREVFGKYGNISSLIMMKTQRENQAEESKFAFICYNDPNDREYGPKCAANAVAQEHEKQYEGCTLYVKEALKK